MPLSSITLGSIGTAFSKGQELGFGFLPLEDKSIALHDPRLDVATIGFDTRSYTKVKDVT